MWIASSQKTFFAMTASIFFFHPDYTVGFGFSPNLLATPSNPARGLFYPSGKITAGRDFRPALKISDLSI